MKRGGEARGSGAAGPGSAGSSGSLCRRSSLLPTVLTFLIIVASGGLLLLIEKGMLNNMETPSPRGDGKWPPYLPDKRRPPPVMDEETRIVHEIRNRTIRTMCRQKNMPKSIWSLSQTQMKILLQHILVSDQYRVLYCYIPKVACSNWKRLLKVLNGVLEADDVSSKLDHRHDLVSLSTMEPDEIRYRLTHYFKFMFVREPMARLLSAYRNKFGEIESYQKNYGVKIIQRYRHQQSVKGDDVTFKEYIRYLLDEDVDRMNEHWMPMYNLCQPCAVSYDFIGSHENLENDAEYVLRQIKAPIEVRFPERQTWYKPVTAEMLKYYVCSLPKKLLRDLLPKYILDFSLFTYPLPTTTTEFCRH